MQGKRSFIRVDDYGFITYLSLMGCELRCDNRIFEVQLSMEEFDSQLSKYNLSNYKKFDDESRRLKKRLKSSAPA